MLNKAYIARIEKVEFSIIITEPYRRVIDDPKLITDNAWSRFSLFAYGMSIFVL